MSERHRFSIVAAFNNGTGHVEAVDEQTIEVSWSCGDYMCFGDMEAEEVIARIESVSTAHNYAWVLIEVEGSSDRPVFAKLDGKYLLVREYAGDSNKCNWEELREGMKKAIKEAREMAHQYESSNKE